MYVAFFSKTNISFNMTKCEASFYTPMAETEQIYTELNICDSKGTSCDIYPIEPTADLAVTVKYVNDMQMIFDAELSKSIIEVDASQCLWPRQDYNIQNCSANIEFNLNEIYTLHIGKNLNNTLNLVPFSSCTNAKMLIRACDITSSNKTYCNSLDWIDINQQYETATINVNKIYSVQTTYIGFQAQIYTLNYFALSDILTDFYLTKIELINTNALLISIDIDDYVLHNKIKNFSALFADDENDNIFVKASATSGVFIFASRTQQ